jgi:DNA replication protein DnaC
MPSQPPTPPTPGTSPEVLRDRARRLGLFGLLANWAEVHGEKWLPRLLDFEEQERQRRSLQRRIKSARLGTFKPIADFDWSWPKKIDRQAVEELLTLDFLTETANVVLVGPSGVGKTMIAKNLAHHALLRGYTVRFTTAGEMLQVLASQTNDYSLAQRLRRYCRPQLTVVDEVGYLSYDARYADLLFEVVTRRYESRSIVLTTRGGSYRR